MRKPWMPPHVAPLDMAYYTHDYFPQLHNTLLVSWHGYRPVGNRLVAYQIDDQGLPKLTKKPTFMLNPVAPGDEFTQHMFTPKGGMKNGEEEAQHVEIISKWNKVANLRPKGAPVGILTLSDGSLLIIDDRNQAILRAQFRLCVGKPSGSIFDLKNLQLRTCESLDIASSPGIAVNTLSRPL